MTGRHTLALIATGLAMLAAPASAAAVDRYVDYGAAGAAPCTDPASPCTTIAEALGPAEDGDVIRLAPGHYIEAVLTEENVTFDGAGPVPPGQPPDFDVHTVVHSVGGPAPAIELRGNGTIRDLTAVGFSAPDDHAEAIVLENFAGGVGPSTVRIENVSAIGGAETDADIGSSPGLHVGPFPVDPITAVVQNSVFETRKTGWAVLARGSAIDLTVRRSQLGSTANGAPRGLGLFDGATGRFEESGLTPSSDFDFGLEVRFGSHLRVVRSSLVFNGFAGIGTSAGGGQSGGLEVVDSLIALEDGAFGITAGGVGETTVSVKGSTIVTYDEEGGRPLHLFTSGPADIDADVVNSVLRSVDTEGAIQGADVEVDAGFGGSASATLRNSSYTTVKTGGGAVAATPAGAGTNISGDPLFLDLTGDDFRLQPASPLIDRGDSAIVAPGQLDLAGAQRSIDGNLDCIATPDIGAFEHDPPLAAMCLIPPAGSPSPPPDVTPVDVTPPQLRLRGGKVRVTRRGVAPVRVTCLKRETERCVGKLMLLVGQTGKSESKRKAQRELARRTLRTRQRSFRIAPGRTAKVSIKLPRWVRGELRRRGKLSATAKLGALDLAGNRTSLNARLKLLVPRSRVR